MSLKRAYSPVLHFDDINGRPLAGGKLYTYAANSSTPATTYRDKEGTLANENPVPLNERGECEVWLVEGRNYKFVLKDRNEVTIWEKDDVSVDSGEGGGSIVQSILTIDEITIASGVLVDENFQLSAYLNPGESFVGSMVLEKMNTGYEGADNFDLVVTFGGSNIYRLNLERYESPHTFVIPFSSTNESNEKKFFGFSLGGTMPTTSRMKVFTTGMKFF